MVDADTADSESQPNMVASTRYRCTACGNLTRFDVTATRRTRSFHHYDVGGALEVEETDVLSEVVEEVSCRWCGSAEAVVEAAQQADAESPSGNDQVPHEAGE